MRKLILFMHVSLDGFVAGENGEMDWIKADDEMFEYAGKRTDEADTALYGRVTFQLMDSYWPTAGEQPGASPHDIKHSNWYNRVERIVVSKTIKADNKPKLRVISDEVISEITKLKQREGGEIIMFGSPTLGHSLTQNKLIDEYWLFVNPMILGHGIPLFKGDKERFPLKLVSSHIFKSGVACLHYGKP